MLVPVLIPSSLLLDACFQSSRQIDPRLVRQADENPKHISHLFANILVLTFFERLFAVFSRYYTSQLPYFLCQASHIGQLVEIAYAIRLNPLIYTFLCFSYRHTLLFLILCIHTNRHRPVVDKLDLHLCTKHACAYLLAKTLAEQFDKAFVHWYSMLVSSST